MPFKIVRNDITRMQVDAIVNTANGNAAVGQGCDTAVYEAAGYEELLQYRREKIGTAKEGEVFITPGFRLQARYIIHAVSPLYQDGKHGEELKLRSCYRKSLRLAKENGIRSLAFPLISTGSFGCPKEEGLRIAADEIGAFLLHNDMEIYLCVFGDRDTQLGKKLYPGLEAYIDRNYVREASRKEYGAPRPAPRIFGNMRPKRGSARPRNEEEASDSGSGLTSQILGAPVRRDPGAAFGVGAAPDSSADKKDSEIVCESMEACSAAPEFEGAQLSGLEERMKHLSDTYSEYLLYLIRERGLENAEVYKRALVDKKTFSKIKNNRNYHPNRLTALCLCVGAGLNLDESKDLLARAGYALSPCDKTDVIFSYFIENEIYDMIELDIQLEEHGLPCIIP